MWQQAAASAFGSALQYMGQKETNEQNVMLAQENRDWTERMSNTQYQRAVIDLSRAGLNPMLAYMNNHGASVPNVGPARVENPASGLAAGIASSAAQVQLINAQLDALKAEAEAKRGQANLSNAQAANESYRPTDEGLPTAKQWNMMADTDLKRMTASMSEAQKNNFEAITRRVANEIDKLAMSRQVDIAHARLLYQQALSEVSRRTLMGSQSRHAIAEAVLAEIDQAVHKREASYAQETGFLSPALRDAGRAFSSARDASIGLRMPRRLGGPIIINR